MYVLSLSFIILFLVLLILYWIIPAKYRNLLLLLASWLYLAVPVQVLNISFFTFQIVSYVVDVYREDMEVEKDFIINALYVSFFPQLVSGPIAKAKVQIAKYKQESI